MRVLLTLDAPIWTSPKVRSSKDRECWCPTFKRFRSKPSSSIPTVSFSARFRKIEVNMIPCLTFFHETRPEREEGSSIRSRGHPWRPACVCLKFPSYFDDIGYISLRGYLGERRKETVMANCECLQGCPFFNDRMKDTQGLGAIYKTKYCLADNSRCARYMVFKKFGKPAVPADLYPNMHDRANQIMSGA
jgi:hypothetical protein